MIWIQLNGGLGNQLFQYATARALALENHVTLCIDQSNLMIKNGCITERAYELPHFYLGQKSQGLIYGKKPMHRLIAMVIAKLLKLAGKVPGVVYLESDSEYQTIRLHQSLFVILQGYFQSHRYFAGYRQQIRQELVVREPLTSANVAVLELIRNTNSVSLHVRRGDYISNPSAQQFHGLCSMEYYLKAIAVLESRFNDLCYFIFSDDIPWCRENFDFLANKHFVDCNDTTAACMDLHLMRHCQYHIIANSSFSWWGAWLAEYGKGTVIYPRQWFVHKPVSFSGRFPDEWEGI